LGLGKLREGVAVSVSGVKVRDPILNKDTVGQTDKSVPNKWLDLDDCGPKISGNNSLLLVAIWIAKEEVNGAA